MKTLIKWFMELTKDSSTETKKWENIVFRANVLLNWGCLAVIIVVYGLCFTSCTPTDRKASDIKLGERMSVLKCGESINLVEGGEYSYLFKRFYYYANGIVYGNGIVDLGGVQYPYELSKKYGDQVYNLLGKDTTFYYQVKIYEQQVTPAGETVQCMQIKKVNGPYRDSMTIGSFEITLLEYNDPYVVLFVENKDEKIFAYAEQTQFVNTRPYDVDLRFSSGSFVTMKIHKDCRLILYEHVRVDGEIKLLQKYYIPYLVDKLNLH